VAALFARKIRNASARQWSGYLHLLHRRFGFVSIMNDPGGGGLWLRKELASSRQLIENVEQDATPIVTPDDPTAPVVAHYILHLFKRGDQAIESLWPNLPGDDVLLDAAHGALREALDHAQIALPVDAHEWRREQVMGWSEERQFALRNLSELADQLRNITVATLDDGTFAFTKRNARRFSSRGRKDVAYAFMYAWIAFLAWIKRGEDAWETAAEDAAMILTQPPRLATI